MKPASVFRRSAGTALRMAAFGAAVAFLAEESASLILGQGWSQAPSPSPSALPVWVSAACGSHVARITVAAAAVCYLGRDIEARLSGLSAAGRILVPLSPSVRHPGWIGPAAALAVLAVAACQMLETAETVATEYAMVLGNPAYAAKLASEPMAGLQEKVTGTVSAGSLAAAAALHYVWHDVKARLRSKLAY
jgi:hypothetical protein